MYQLLNHLSDSKQIPPERLIQYSVLLQTAQDKNKQLKKLDIEVYKLQREFIQFLKQIGVQKHYTIAFEYSISLTSCPIIITFLTVLFSFLFYRYYVKKYRCFC